MSVKSFRTAGYPSAIALAVISVISVIWLAPFVSLAADEAEDAKPVLRPYEKIEAAEAKRAEQLEKRNAARNGRISERRARMGKTDRSAESGAQLMWWNESGIVEELGLSEKMRGEFDTYFEASKSDKADRDALKNTKRKYYDALKQGNWSNGEKALAKWVELVIQPVDSVGKLKLKVLASLNDEQREKLATKFSSIIVTKWDPRRRWGPRTTFSDGKPNNK